MDPITTTIALGAGGSGSENAWVRHHGRWINRYYRYIDAPHRHVVYDAAHCYFVYSIRATYSGQTGSHADRLEMWKVKMSDGSTVWHKSLQPYTTSPHFGTFQLFGADISPNGNYLLIAIRGDSSSAANGQSNLHNMQYVEYNTSDGSLRTTSQGALYAGGLKDSSSYLNHERAGGVLYAPGSNNDWICSGGRATGSGHGFFKLARGSSSYTCPWWAMTHNTAPYTDQTGNTSSDVGSISYNPDNSNELYYHHQVYNGSYRFHYVSVYDISSGTPSFNRGFYFHTTFYDSKFCFAFNGNDVYLSWFRYNLNGGVIEKHTWNGSGWTPRWKSTQSHPYGASYTGGVNGITYDKENDRLVVLETEYPSSLVYRQINPATGANVDTRRICISENSNDTNLDPSTLSPSGALQLANYDGYANNCPRAKNGFAYFLHSGTDDYYNKKQGALILKLPTDISQLPSAGTSSSDVTRFSGGDTGPQNTGDNFTLAFSGYEAITYSSSTVGLTALTNKTSSGYTNNTTGISNLSLGAGNANGFVTANTSYWPPDCLSSIE